MKLIILNFSCLLCLLLIPVYTMFIFNAVQDYKEIVNNLEPSYFIASDSEIIEFEIL